jgi:hypothetical protein
MGAEHSRTRSCCTGHCYAPTPARTAHYRPRWRLPMLLDAGVHPMWWRWWRGDLHCSRNGCCRPPPPPREGRACEAAWAAGAPSDGTTAATRRRRRGSPRLARRRRRAVEREDMCVLLRVSFVERYGRGFSPLRGSGPSCSSFPRPPTRARPQQPPSSPRGVSYLGEKMRGRRRGGAAAASGERSHAARAGRGQEEDRSNTCDLRSGRWEYDHEHDDKVRQQRGLGVGGVQGGRGEDGGAGHGEGSAGATGGGGDDGRQQGAISSDSHAYGRAHAGRWGEEEPGPGGR